MPVAPAPDRGARARYDLEATVLDARADDPALLDGLDSFIGERRMAARRPATFRLDIARGVPAPLPDGAEILYRGPLHEEGICAFGRTSEAYWLVFAGAATLSVRPEAKSADIVVAEGGLRHARAGMIALALEFALDADGQHMVHCAGLSFPGSDRAMLLCAPSGTGKTTTALVLARAGFGLATDDVMVLHREGDAIRAWGLPRAVKVHRRTAALLPWLGSIVGARWDAGGEQAVARARLGTLLNIDDRSLRVTDILLLRRGAGPEAKLQPLDKAEMLAALAADNLRKAKTGLPPLQARRYAMLADAVNTASAFELTVPSELDSLAAAVRTLSK